MKKKLIASIFSLVMAFVLMTSASFAWFTVSTSAAVNSVEATMSATKNLEIAKATNAATAPSEVTSKDATDETKWGAIVSTLKTEATDTTNVINFPATFDATAKALKTIGYDKTGRTNDVTVTGTAGEMSSGVGLITATVPYGDGTTEASVSKNIAVYYGVWLRSNEDCTVNCTPGGTISAVDTAGTAVVWNEGFTNATAVKVALDINGDVYGVTDGKISFGLTANTATLVKVIVYVEGDACIAQSVANGIKISGLKLDFAKATA